MDNILKSNCSNVPIILYGQTDCSFKKAMEGYFPMLIQYCDIKQCKMVLTYRWTLTIVKATKQYFRDEMFIILYIYNDLTFVSLDEIIQMTVTQSTTSFATVYYAVQGWL